MGDPIEQVDAAIDFTQQDRSTVGVDRAGVELREYLASRPGVQIE
jgi:hypothetical protein